MHIKGIVAVTITICLILVSCGKTDTDITPPSLEVISYLPTPIEDEICGGNEPLVFRINSDGGLAFDVVFSDDQALSQYKIDIHNNFDCHGHGGGSAPSIPTPSVDNQTTDWTVLDIQNISGLSSPVQRTIEVPDNVTAGNYHFHLQVIDESGNDSPFANFHSIKVKNLSDTEPPTITVSEPVASSFTASRGEIIRFSGTVTDNKSLSEGGNGILYLAYTDLSSGNTFTTDKAFGFENNVDTEYAFDFEYEIPSTLISGDYRLSLGANDGVRNVGEFVFFEVAVD